MHILWENVLQRIVDQGEKRKDSLWIKAPISKGLNSSCAFPPLFFWLCLSSHFHITKTLKGTYLPILQGGFITYVC